MKGRESENMASVNKHIILGRLGQDPEVRYTQSGTAVCNLSIATDGFGDNAETEWHDVVVWGKAAEQCGQYLQKGREVYLEGEVRTDKWTDRDGNERKTKKVHTNFVQFIGGGGNGGGQRDGSNRNQNRVGGQGGNRQGNNGGWGSNNNQQSDDDHGGGQSSGGGWGKKPAGNNGGGWGGKKNAGGGWGKKPSGEQDQGNGGSGGRSGDDNDPIPF